jgi:hypothetical protein
MELLVTARVSSACSLPARAVNSNPPAPGACISQGDWLSLPAFFARQDYEKNKDFGMMMGIKPDKRRIL